MTARFLPQTVTKGTQLARTLLAGWLVCVFSVTVAVAGDTPLRMGLADAPLTLDATRASEATSQRPIRLISFGLTAVDSQRRIIPAAATLTHQDRRHFTFQLRPLRFTDGTLLTPAWVKRYYENIKAPESPSIMKQAAQRIESITTDAKTRSVTFTLREEGLSPWQLFGFWSLFTVPFTLTTPEGQVYGLGPYDLTTHTPGKLTLTPRDSHLAPLELLVVKDPTVRVLKLMNNELDLLQDDIPLELFIHARKQGMQAVTGPSASYTYMGFNHADPALGQQKVRQAIAHALNLPEIRKDLLFGLARPAESILLPQHPAHWGAPDWVYDPAAARKLLAEAGYSGTTPLRLTLTLSTNPLVYRVGQVMQQQLAEVGVELTLQTLEWASFYANIQNGRAQMYMMNLVGDFDPDIFHLIFNSHQTPPLGMNRGRVNLPAMDKLTDALQHEFSPQKQKTLATDIQKIQHQNLLFLPLWRLDRFALMRPGISGYSLNPVGDWSGLLHVSHEDAPQPPASQQP